MGALDWIFNREPAANELGEIYSLGISQNEFVKTDTIAIYSKILTDVAERTHGLSTDQQHLLWDNCLMSENNEGLISMLAKAMTDKDDLFLVYDKSINLIRRATQEEKQTISLDYKQKGISKAGVYISFKLYKRTDMVKLYSAIEHCSVNTLNKMMALSSAIQIKPKNLRSSTGTADKKEAEDQAKAIAEALSEGSDIMIDAEDMIEMLKPHIDSVEQSMEKINEKRSFYLGMSASYITGYSEKGLGDSGEAEQKANERGFKNYFFSIFKPTCKALFGVDVTYKSQDFRQISQGLEALKTFSIIDATIMPVEKQQLIVNQLFDFDDAGGSDDTGSKKKA